MIFAFSNLDLDFISNFYKFKMNACSKRWSKYMWYKCLTVLLVCHMATMMYHARNVFTVNDMDGQVTLGTVQDTQQSSMKTGPRSLDMESHTKTGVKTSKHTKDVTEGYDRAKRLWKRCTGKRKIMSTVNLTQVLAAEHVQMCLMWKVGSHTLRRIFTVKGDEKYQTFNNPYDVPLLYESPKIERRAMDNNVLMKRYMFVREPYRRLYAVYIDKVLAPNTVFWWRFGIPAIQLFRKNPSKKSLECGHDTTFSEYIKFVIATLTRTGETINGVKLGSDLHHIPYVRLCQPCTVKYDFIGKMERFDTDVIELLDDLELNKSKRLLSEQGGELSAIDAIKDTAFQPFDGIFTKQLKKCIGEYNALKRAWLKLQIRGLIGEQELPFQEADAQNMTYEYFLQMAFAARQNSTKTERKMLKNRYQKKYFNSISNEDMQKLSKIYAEDLHLFEYEKIPVDLFV